MSDSQTPQEALIARCKAAVENLNLGEVGSVRAVDFNGIRASFEGMGAMVKEHECLRAIASSAVQAAKVAYAVQDAMAITDAQQRGRIGYLEAENARLAGELAARTQERDKVYDELISETVGSGDAIRTLSETVSAQKNHIAELREHNIELAREVLRAKPRKPKPKKPVKRAAKKARRK